MRFKREQSRSMNLSIKSNDLFTFLYFVQTIFFCQKRLNNRQYNTLYVDKTKPLLFGNSIKPKRLLIN